MGNCLSDCYNTFIKKSHFERKVSSIINDLNLDIFQKRILYKRYVRQVSLYERRTKECGFTYNSFRTVVTVGSILLPALLSIQNNDDEKAVYAYTQWGFTDMTKNKLEVLNKWAEFIYSPLMDNKIQKIQHSDSGIYGAQVATKVHNELRKLGGVKPPKEFVFMDRAAVGLGSVFMHLKAEVNWYKIFHNLIRNFETKKMNTRQQKILKLVEL